MAFDITDVLGEIPKNSKEKIVFRRIEREGVRFMDIRVFWLTETGEWKWSKKGVDIPWAAYWDMMRILHRGLRPEDLPPVKETQPDDPF